MFKFLRRRGNLRDDNASDIITEAANINISDSAPILNRNFDLSINSNSVHDLRRNDDPEGLFFIQLATIFLATSLT